MIWNGVPSGAAVTVVYATVDAVQEHVQVERPIRLADDAAGGVQVGVGPRTSPARVGQERLAAHLQGDFAPRAAMFRPFHVHY